MNIKQKIAKDINYQVEVVFFMVNFPIYKQKLFEFYNDKEKNVIIELEEEKDDNKKKDIIKNVIVPDINKYEKGHFKTIYYYMLLSKGGRQYLKYLKENGC